ncbi:MAG: hypothetical protein E4G99_00475 [Anaerolineales bacterium]|nr:MAG: hypothetical protein E4G99_00475 [Anaerolineales bacterium]
MISRFAAALILIGLILLTVFVLTLQVEQGDFRVLLFGSALSTLGILLRRRAARRARQTSQRFSTLRRLRGIQEDELD